MKTLENIPGTAPYRTCTNCVAERWCGRRCGRVALPKDYPMNSECSGFIMLEQALKLSKIPPEYRNANLRSFEVDDDNREYVDLIERILSNPIGYVESGMNVTLLHSNKGTGKTYTACAIANEFIYKACMNPKWFDYENPCTLYVNFGDWANEIRRAHQVGDSALYEQMYINLNRMKTVSLLVLDDIGSGRITDVIRDLTYDIVNKRKEELLPTIFTSNMVDTVLSRDEKLGEVIVSRMMYNAIHIGLGGHDRRTA